MLTRHLALWQVKILLVKIANIYTEQAVDDYLLFAGCLQEKEYL